MQICVSHLLKKNNPATFVAKTFFWRALQDCCRTFFEEIEEMELIVEVFREVFDREKPEAGTA